MPKRIEFHVIYATSEVAEHPASELGWAGPASRGWRSASEARAPHELVLQLTKRVAITRVQLLAHQHLIPKRIEFLVHDSEGGAPRTPSSPQYEAVGWVALAEGGGNLSADDTASAARELRTASVPKRPARYLRLRLSEPHENDKNTQNQVALMGVNIFGIEMDVDETPRRDSNGSERAPAKSSDDSEYYSPYDDLAFIMYVDNEIADVIRQLEVKKQSAILEERFEYARKLKAACQMLGAGGRVLGGLQLQKRLAAASEQYERATRKRDAIATGRARLAAAVNLDNLLETNGPNTQNDEYSFDENPFSIETLTFPTSNLSFDAPSPPNAMQPPTTSKDIAANSQEMIDGHFKKDMQSHNDSVPHSNNDNVQPSSIVIEENRIYYVKDEVMPHKNIHHNAPDNEQINSNSTEHQGKYNNKVINNLNNNTNDRIMSPYCEKEQIYVENNHYPINKMNGHPNIIHRAPYNQNNTNTNSTVNNSCEVINRICFEDQITIDTQNGDAEYGSGSRSGKNQHPVVGVANIKEKNDFILMSSTNSAAGRLASTVREGSYFNSPANSISPTSLHYNPEICRNGQGSPANSSRSSGQNKTSSVSAALASQQASSVVVKRRNRSAGPPVPAHHRSSYEAYEERLVPALRHSHTNEFLRGCQIEQTESTRGRPKMGERERKQAALPILIFGEQLVEKIYSKHFAEKEDGLQNLKSELRSFDGKTPSGAAALSPNKAARAAAMLLHRALRDPVFSVYSLAAELTRVFFTEFVNGRVNAAEVSRSVERLVPELLTRAGDPAPRVHSLAMHTLLTMADCPPVRSLNIIPGYLVRPLTAGTAPRLALSRLLMVEQLLLNHGIDKNSGLKTRAVAELGAGGLTHGQGAVRRAAERLLLAAYEKAPRLVRAQLPPDDPVTRRNLLYRHLFEGFDRVDRRKQEQSLGNINQNDGGSYLGDPVNNLKMMESMSTSSIQMSTSQMSSSMSSSMGASMYGSLCQPKSSLKRPSSKKSSTVGFNGVKRDTEYPGYNKLRLDSAVSPKHQPKTSKTPSQNPRTYVLEKNWQNSVMMQNGNFCPQSENVDHSNKWDRINDEQSINIVKQRKNVNNQYSEMTRSYREPTGNGCENSPTNGKSMFRNSVSNGVSHPYQKGGMVARNLHSNIVFDNRCSYGDEENLQNGIRKMKMADSLDNMVDITKNDEKITASPTGSLKRNKNIKSVIYRSKSGSNVPTCFDDDNFDSFDDSQMEVDSLEYCKDTGDEETLRESVIADCENHENYRSDASSPELKVDAPEEEGQCPFCVCNIAEGDLDVHYWKVCPLLGRCSACRAPLEIRVMSQHLTEDCPQSNEFRHCSRCKEAINIENYLRHLADNDCLETTENYWKCPLCHLNVAADEESWRNHLSGRGTDKFCSMNPRIQFSKQSGKVA